MSVPNATSITSGSGARSGVPCVLAPSLGEAWPWWSPQVVSLIVHDATLPVGWASLGDRCPGCVAGGRCPVWRGDHMPSLKFQF